MVWKELYRYQPIKTRQGIAEVPFADAWSVTYSRSFLKVSEILRLKIMLGTLYIPGQQKHL